MGKVKYNQAVVDEIISLYYGGLSAKMISKELKIPAPSIEVILTRNNIHRHSRIGLGLGRKHTEETKAIISEKHKASNHKPTKEAADAGRINAIKARWGRHTKDPKVSMFNSYKRSAKRREIGFDLTIDDFSLLIKQPCFYCEEPPKERIVCKLPFVCNGIDRNNNAVGYVLANCVPCCTKCNFMKMKLSQEDLINQCAKITQKWAKTNLS